MSRQRDYQKRQQAKGRCMKCPLPLYREGGRYCERHLEAHRRHNREYMRRHRASMKGEA